MIDFVSVEGQLLLKYSPINGTNWIVEEFNNGNTIHVKRTYTLSEENLYSNPFEDEEEVFFEDEAIFIVAKLEGEYYRFNKDILGIDYELLIHKSAKFRDKMFSAYRNISIFRSIFNLIKTNLIIGNRKNEFPIIAFESLIKTFPNSNETQKYVASRIGNILREYLDLEKDAVAEYNAYLNKKQVLKNKSILINKYSGYEVDKYSDILFNLKEMLRDEKGYSEKAWQKEILGILQLLYPKYICVFEEVVIKDVYSSKNRRLDYMLVDANGNIDIVEIKKPSDSSIVSATQYRQNYVPRRDLSGAIMQIEKYAFFLNKWGKVGEEKLTSKYQKSLPDNFRIRITNPGGIVIMGKENELNKQQLNDLEIIKRKYKNIIDILTYEDLIRRLEQIIFKFKKCK